MGDLKCFVLHRRIDAIVSVHIKVLSLHICPFMVSDCNHYFPKLHEDINGPFASDVTHEFFFWGGGGGGRGGQL